ncbi:MaoC/PaaZ C-terminal domain-containing protein [Cryptosporangium arvum]|uniref:MaoC/PaaZ C-terminal domain-containing protein n=1 Tax=Cryptosporangium arvum TaxID=80871 RepID=UPI00056A21C7|nr:MaoC/PaaZ C-terminal domain-containing protein [Cryptosporangium arvum]
MTEPRLLHPGLTWEEQVDLVFRTNRRTVTEADLVQFVTWSGFVEPLFYDAEHARSAGYSGRLVPGGLVYSIAEGLVMISGSITGTGLAFLGMELTVKGPTFVGDTLYAVVTTLEARPSSKPGRGVVRTEVSVRNQRDEEVLVYTPVRLIRGHDYAEPRPDRADPAE